LGLADRAEAQSRVCSPILTMAPKRGASKQPQGAPPEKKPVIDKEAPAELEQVTQPEAAEGTIAQVTELVAAQPAAEQKKAPEEKTEKASPEFALRTVESDVKRLAGMKMAELLSDDSVMVPEAILERCYATMLKHSTNQQD